MTLRTRRLKLAVAVASTFVSLAAGAQEAATSTAADAAPQQNTPKQSAAKQEGIQTVVVTANKRKEDASKVAISMSVIGGDELQAQHITDYADVTRSIPNISFSGAGGGGDAGDGPGLSNIQIRGISSAAGSATVGVYLDDVSMTQANQYSMGTPEPKFFDVDHVEVLRGPQGTLYGASSMGGTVKFITNQPDSKEESFDFFTQVSQMQHANTPNYNGNFVVNKPLIPGELALRFGVQAEHIGGYINQIGYDPTSGATSTVANGINWQDNGVMKLALKWTPTKDLAITPSIISQKVKTGDTDVSYSQLLYGGNVITDGAGNPIQLGKYETSKTTNERGTDTLTVPSLTVNWDAGIGDVTSVTSFFKRDFTRIQDGTFTNSWQIGTLYVDNNAYPELGNYLTTLPSSVTLANEVRQFSQELRLASKPYVAGGDPVTWLVGAYAANGHTTILENDFVYGINNAFTLYGQGQTPTSFPGVWNTNPPGNADCNAVYCSTAASVAEGFPNDNTWHGEYRYHDSQQSVFGEANYYFMPELHATVGLRYLRGQQTYDSFQDLFYQGDQPTPNHSTTNGSKTTPKFAVIWETSPTNSVFATAAEGFRLGGTNSSLPVEPCSLPGPNPTGYSSDSLWSYEVGDKSRFLNNTLQINAALFYVKWKNMQQEIELPCSFAYDVNVGSATSYGGELELKYKPTPSLLFDLAGGMTHATLDSTVATLDPTTGYWLDSSGNFGVAGAVKGTWIPGVPKFNVALTGTYSFDINDDYYAFFRGAAHMVGTSYGGFSVLPDGSPNPDYQRPSYHTFDVSTGVTYKEWEATFFIKNLANNNMVIQRPVEQAQASGLVYLIAPREVGVSLSAKF